MTPGARVAAAIELLDAIAAGTPAEAALTRWGRSSRFAGSKDRAAVRDLVFDSLRNWRSDAVLGGGDSGRLRLLGRLRAMGAAPEELFTGDGHAPAPLSAEELAGGATPETLGDRWNLPDWLVPVFQAALGEQAADAACLLADRAPITIRVNARKTDVASVTARLAEDGIVAQVNDLAPHAVTVVENARRLRNTTAFAEGLFEFQDAASQAFVAALPEAKRALDYCAGGGGKALAMAARGMAVTAHDGNPRRMKDIPVRAKRAGVKVPVVAPDALRGAGRFDLVVVDAPCSGSGTWRRGPEAKWALTEARLTELCDLQVKILMQASDFVEEGGVLAYSTCSIFPSENHDVLARFTAEVPGWRVTHQDVWPVSAEGDGFFGAHLKRV